MAFDINTAVLEDNSSSSFDINTATLNDELVETNKVEEKADITPEQLRSIPAQISAAPKTQSYLEPLATDTQIFKKPENVFESFQQAFHWLTQVPVSAYKSGYNNIDVADLEMKGIYSGKELNTAQLNQLEKLQTQSFGRYNRNNNYQISEADYKQKDPFTILGAAERIPNLSKKWYAETFSQLPIMIESIKSGGAGGVIGGGAGGVIGAGAAIVGGQLGPQVATPEEIVTVPTAAIQGAKRGFLFGGRVGAAKRVFELEAGLTKNELRTINKEIENEGGEPLSEQELNLFAIGVGGVNAGLEIASLEKLLETIPNGKQIIDKLKDKQLKALIQNPTVRNQMLDVLKKYGTAALTEASTEAAQEATNIIAGETVRKLGELEPTPMVDNVKRVIDAGSTGFGVALFLGGVGSTAQTVTILTKKGVSKQEATEIANGMTPEERHQFVDENSDVLLRSVEDLPEVKELQAKKMYKESLFKQAKQAGYDDVRANTNAELIAESFANLAKQTGMSIEDIQNEANIVIQNLSDQEAIQQYNEDSRKVLQGRVEEVKYQSAASAGANENEVAKAEKEYAEKGTESKYFKRYFDGSKAVDEDGKPLILYHNTNSEFEAFSRKYEGQANGRPVYGGGFNFTQYKDYAGQFGKKQMAVYLSIKNPLNEETYDAEKFIEPVAELMYGKDYKKYLLKYDDYYATGYLEGKLDTLYGLRDLMQGLQYDKGVDVIEFYKSLGYDGIQDGHIWVAFEPEQIKSVDNRGTFDANNPNIYYQAMIAGINPKQKVDVLDLSAAFVNDKNLSKAKLSSYIQTLIKPKTQNNNKISSKDKKALFSFIKRSKRVGKNDVYIPDHIANSSKVETQYKGERATFVNNIVNLIQHSVLIDIDKNKDKKTKPNVDNYLRFYVPVRINNDIFTVRITAENNVSENLFNILNADVYDVIIDKKMSSPVLIPANKQRNIMKMTSNNIITQSQQSSSVEKITIEEMLKGVQNPEKKLYFQSIDNIKQNFDYSAQELEEMFKADVLNILQENMIDESEFNFEDIKLYGSFSTNKNKKGSDLDFLVQYSGEMREDAAFNLLNEQGLTITDVNGNEVKVDFNPIRTDVTGSIDEYLKNNSKIYFQSIEDDKLRFVQITDRTENEVELNNSIWLSTQTMAKEGLSYNNQKIGATTWLDFSRKNLKDVDISKLKNIQQITENQIIEKEKHNPEIETIAEEYFGTTTNLKEAGYVLSNGKLLDLSGKKFGGVAGRRSIDHREINDAFLENDNYNEIGIEEFIDNGAIRYMPEASRLLIARMPSNEQFAALENIINKNNGEISIEMVNNMSDWGKSDKSFYKDYEMWSDPKKVLDDVRTYFNGGKISEHKTYYQSIEDDSNLNDTERGIIDSRGFTYEKEYFDGQAKENIIVLLKNKADASTLIHEFAHVYLITLNNLARNNVKAKELLLTVNKWLRYDGGGEYTTAQHEKFANGFVAYVKAGKAPSYGLKRVFENFRRWLGDIWNSVSQSDEFEIDEEYSKVFNQLLGDVSVQNQDEMIEKIIDDAKQNASLRLLNENIEKGDVKFNELTETQRRYRDTAYEIVFTALKNSKDEETRNYVQSIQDLRMKLGSGSTKSLQRQKERIEFLLSELDDPFSASDGFHPEWGEFFTDTGVSYDNQEVGADAELALDALDVIVNKKYLFSDNNFGELSEREVKQYEYEYEYILNQYKYANDKTIPMTAFYQWTGTIHPYLQDEFYKKWENETNEIDRYQNLSKFEQAKEDLKYKAAQMQGLGDYSQQFAEYAREIIKRLDFMTERDKAKIFDKLKDFNSFREVQANLDDVMDFAETLYNVTERRKIADDIIREVKQTIHEWKDGIKRTKYTYPANKLFERLRELNKLPQQDIQDIYDAQVNEEIKPTYEADKVNTDDYYETIEKMFIEFKANGVYYNSSEFLQDLLTRIQNAKFTAKIARDEMDFERRMQAINLIDDCAKAVAKHKGKTSTLEKLYRLGFNLNSALEMMFDKNTKEKFTLDYLYAQKDAKVGADRDVVLKRLKDVFGFQGKLSDTFLFNQFINMTKKEFTLHQRYTPDIAQGVIRQTHRDKETGLQFTDKTIEYSKGKPRTEWEAEEIQLSRMELLYYYILSMNEDTYNILTDMGSETQAPKGQFDKYELEEKFNQLTPQEKMMGVVLQQAAEKYWPELNRYHIKKYHTELGKTKNYFPRKTELTEVKPLELFNDYVQYSGKISAQKQRTAGLGSRIAPANALAVLFDHIEKANTLITMGEQLDLMNRVFKEPNLKKKIEAVWGIDTTNEFYNHIAGNLYSGQQSIISDAEKHIGRLSSNVIKAQIFAKAQVGLKQVISFLNYGTGDEFVSSSEWGAAFWKQSFTPKEWKKNIEYMMNIPYLKDRFGRGGSTDALKRELETRLFAKMSLLDDFFSLPIKVGDMGAIILGGKPYIDVLIQKGYTEEQAQKIFIEKTVNEMQSSIPSTLSNMQRNAAKQPLTKMIFAYQNTPWQYFRVAANSIIQFKQNPNKYTGLNMVKIVGLYMYVFPLIFNLASSFSPLTGDEDELRADLWKSALGNFMFIPIGGMFIMAMLNGALGERISTGNWFDTAAAKAGNMARKIAKGDDITVVDMLKVIALFGEMYSGLPLTTLGTEVSGVYDIATGSPTKGALKVAGYSDYRAKKVSGEEK